MALAVLILNIVNKCRGFFLKTNTSIESESALMAVQGLDVMFPKTIYKKTSLHVQYIDPVMYYYYYPTGSRFDINTTNVMPAEKKIQM